VQPMNNQNMIHPWVVLFLAIVSCSLLNREGPDVTCADLKNGATNACSDGITATCLSGQIVYEVCQDEMVCKASWQTIGRYRCSDSDPLPEMGAGGQTQGGQGGMVGIAGTLGESSGAAGVSVGGFGGTGANGGSSGAQSCEEGVPCVVGVINATGKSIDGYAIDNTRAYFTDCATVWSVPKGGGLSTVLGTFGANCETFGNLFVDDTHVYWMRRDGTPSIARVPKAGGPVEAVASPPDVTAIAIDNQHIFWIEEPQNGFAKSTIKRMAKTGGAAEVVVTGQFYLGGKPRLMVADDSLYWLGSSKFLSSISSAATDATVVSTLALSYQGDSTTVQDFSVDGTSVFAIGTIYTSSGAGTSPVAYNGIWRIDLMTGSTTQVVKDIPSSPAYMTLDMSSIFWGSYNRGIFMTPKSGGGPTPVAIVEDNFNPGRVVVDEQFVYWSRGWSIYRAKKAGFLCRQSKIVRSASSLSQV
jgi:hypothetical protein